MEEEHSTGHTKLHYTGIGMNSHLNIESKRDYRSILLSYRRYNKLSQGEKNQFNLDCLNHPPRIWQIALFLTKVYHIKFNRILFKKAYDFLEDFDKASLKFQNQVIIPDKYLIRELRWELWKPLSDYKIRNKYAYFMTNRKLDSEIWVYPIRFSDNYETSKKGKYQSYTEMMGKLGFPGLTKISYSDEH